LDEDRYDPAGLFAEVYDDSQPATGVEVLAREALPVRPRIQLMDVWPVDRREDRVNVVQELRTAPGDM
jgi:hypothetical protein